MLFSSGNIYININNAAWDTDYVACTLLFWIQKQNPWFVWHIGTVQSSCIRMFIARIERR